MRRAAAPFPHPGADSGFTLLEMLVVLAIAGLIAGLIYPQVATASFALRQRLAREHVASGVEAARAMALRSGAPVALAATDDGTGLLVAGARRIALDPTGQLRVTLRPQSIVFYPDGSTTGGELVLGTGSGAARFAVSATGGRLQAEARK